MFNGNANLVKVSVTFWTGQATLSRPEMDAARGQKLPLHGKLLDLIEPALFVPFKTIKSRQIRACRKHAIKYGEDWLVSREYFDKLEEDLVAVRREWNNAVACFVNSYVDNMKAWRNKYPGAVMRSMQANPNNMHERFHFGWTALQFIPADTVHDGGGNETMRMLGSLSSDTLDDMLRRARALYNESFKGKGNPSGKAWDAIGNLARDCRVLSFANQMLARMAGMYEALQASRNANLVACLLTLDSKSMPNAVARFDAGGLDAWQTNAEPVTTQSLIDQAVKLLEVL